MLAPAPHLASPRSPETARLAFLSTYAILVLTLASSFILVGCASYESGKPIEFNGKAITVEGVVSESDRRDFEYSVTCKAGEYALDVVTLRGIELGRVYVVSGTLIDYGESVPEWGARRMLTKVSIDGVRIQTHLEWSEEYDLDTEELIEYMNELTKPK